MKKVGKLKKNDGGRYELIGEGDEFLTEYSSGSSIEFLANKYRDEEVWIKARVEYSDDYYIVGSPNIILENLKARIEE